MAILNNLDTDICFFFQMVGILGYVEVIAPKHLRGTAISLTSGCMFILGNEDIYIIENRPCNSI